MAKVEAPKGPTLFLWPHICGKKTFVMERSVGIKGLIFEEAMFAAIPVRRTH